MNIIFADYPLSFTYFVSNGFQPNPEYYECSANVTLNPPDVRRELWGAYYIFSGIFILILYFTVSLAIATTDLVKIPAYKMMLVLSVFDISSIIVFAIFTGTLAFFGATFCDCPRLNFILGSIGIWSWLGSCSASMILAFIRICDVAKLKLRKLFRGRKIYVFIWFCSVYGFSAAMLTTPFIFSPANMSWLFNPGVGKDPSLYTNSAHTFNNCFVVFGTVALYSYLAYLFLENSKSTESKELYKYKTNVLIQAFFFCVFHLICAVLYVYMQYFSAPKLFMIVAHLAWQFGTASVCIVSLTRNRSVRKAVFHLIYGQESLPSVSQVGPAIASMDSRAVELQLPVQMT